MYSAFLSYLYDYSHQKRIEDIVKLLNNLDLNLIDGKHFKSNSEISVPTQKAIGGCDLLIAIFNGFDKDDYLIKETNLAAAIGKPVIIIANSGERLVLPDSAYSDLYLISFANGEIKVAAAIVEAIKCIKNKLFLLKEDNVDRRFLVELEKEQWDSDILKSLREIRDLFDCLDYDRALEKAKVTYSIHPKCWRAGIANSAALMFLQHFSEAEDILENMIQSFRGNARALSHAYQNKGWLVYTKLSLLGNLNEESILEIISYFKISLQCEPRSIVYIDLICLLLQTNRIQEAELVLFDCLHHFPDAKPEFYRQLQIRGADFIQAIAKSSILLKILFPKGQALGIVN